MDFEKLKAAAWRLINACEKDGKHLTFAALTYYYFDGKENHYRMFIAGDGLQTTNHEGLSYLIQKKFEVFDLETRILISEINVLTTKKPWPVLDEADILVNEINYKPNYQQLFADMMD